MIGETISHYKILTKLGEGGMGEVYKALDERLGRPVAIKLLPRRMFREPAEVERFLHEARAASALNHPNITTLYEFDEVQGEFFIAMEFVEGETVKELIQERPGGLPIEDALMIAIQAGEALAQAHAKGIVHRDVKSSNIIVASDGTAKVTDFGLAKLGEATSLTRSGVTMGTAGYMAPEQAKGEAVDRRADVYSLGVVLYEMLTGGLPFSGDADLAVLYAVVHEEAAPIRRLRPEVSTEIELVVSRAMEKAPAARYQTMETLVEDLREATRVLRGGTTPRLRRWGRQPVLRRWALPVLLGLAALTVLTMKGNYLLKTGDSLGTPVGDPVSAIASYREALKLEPHDIEALLGLCESLLTRSPEEARQHATQARVLAPQNARARKCEGDALYYLADYGQALDRFEEAYLLWADAQNRAGMANALNGIAVAADVLGDLQRAEAAYTEARRLWREAGDGRGLAKTLSNLGNFYRARGRYGEAAEALVQALELYRSATDRLGEAHALTNLGVVYRWTDQYKKAENYYNQVLALAGEMGDAMLQVSAYGNLAATWQIQGRYEEAHALYRQALKKNEEIENQAGVAEMAHVLGGMLREWGDYPEAMRLTDRGLTLARRLGARTEEMGALVEMGLIHLDLGRWEEARTDLETGLSLAQDLHRQVMQAVAQRWLGVIAEQRGRSEEARARYQAALEVAQQVGREREIKYAEVALIGLRAQGRLLEDDLRRCQSVVSWAEQAGVYLLEIAGRLCRAEAFLGLNRYEEGLSEAFEARGLAQKARLWQWEFEASALMGRLYDQAGNRSAATLSWEDALEIVERVRERLGAEDQGSFMKRPDIGKFYTMSHQRLMDSMEGWAAGELYAAAEG